MRAFVCVVWLLALPAVAESNYAFDRVFTTPEERRALDALRRSGEPLPSAVAGHKTGDGADVRETEKVRFSGYLLRSDGKQTLWVDGSSEIGSSDLSNAGALHGRLRAGADGVHFRARSEARVLKPGQLWLLNDNRVMEAYQLPPEPPALPADADGD